MLISTVQVHAAGGASALCQESYRTRALSSGIPSFLSPSISFSIPSFLSPSISSGIPSFLSPSIFSGIPSFSYTSSGIPPYRPFAYLRDGIHLFRRPTSGITSLVIEVSNSVKLPYFLFPLTFPASVTSYKHILSFCHISEALTLYTGDGKIAKLPAFSCSCNGFKGLMDFLQEIIPPPCNSTKLVSYNVVFGWGI